MTRFYKIVTLSSGYLSKIFHVEWIVDILSKFIWESIERNSQVILSEIGLKSFENWYMFSYDIYIIDILIKNVLNIDLLLQKGT